MKLTQFILFPIFFGILYAQGSDVTFTLTIDTGHDAGDTYENLFASGDGFDVRDGR